MGRISRARPGRPAHRPRVHEVDSGESARPGNSMEGRSGSEERIGAVAGVAVEGLT